MTSKQGTGVGSISTPTIECCMCGDYGLPSELFRCNLCSFRSQHKYCSNLYPKAQSYQLCNWCLKKDEQGKSEETTHNSSSFKHSNGDDNQKYNNRIDCKNDNKSEVKKNRVSNLKIQIRSSNSQLMNYNNNNNNPMKKQRCLDRLSSSSPSSVGRSLKKIKLEAESLRRTKSEEISNNTPSTPKQVVFRGKARRYKLLEEVSSQ